MNLGIWAALLWVLFAGIANTAMKYIATDYKNNYTALLLQYVSMAVFALLYVFTISTLQGTSVFPTLDMQSFLILVIVGVIGFIGIAFLFKAFDHLNAGVTMIVAQTSVFMMFFVNIWLFAGAEKLGLIQIILSLVFFVIIAQFLWTQSWDSKFRLNWAIVYPLITAVCWTVFFVGNTWFVKNAIMTPVQSVFATESIILVVALIWYLFVFRGSFRDVGLSFRKQHILPFVVIGLCNVGANFLFYYGYLDNPANIINFMRLFGIVVTAVLSWIFLRDILTKKQILLMVSAFVVLMLFIFL